jgi:hypothetical protein
MYAAEDTGVGGDILWRNLLHVQSDRPLINDPDFILTNKHFSVQFEYQKNLEYATKAPAQYFCKFPARYMVFYERQLVPKPDISLCDDLKEFVEKAPVENVSLVFAAEDISSSSSMMGHLMLKIEGVNIDGLNVQHAISYFTDANTVNVPKLLFDSLIVGKDGYYTLSPYVERLRRYNINEQRNVWE